MSQSLIARTLLQLSLFVTPAHLREERSEQWRADLRDCGELEIPSRDILAGALLAGARPRIANGLEALSGLDQRKEKKATKILLPDTLMAAVLALGGIAGASKLSNHKVTYFPVTDEMIQENARTTPNDLMIIDGHEVLGGGEIAPTYPGE